MIRQKHFLAKYVHDLVEEDQTPNRSEFNFISKMLSEARNNSKSLRPERQVSLRCIDSKSCDPSSRYPKRARNCAIRGFYFSAVEKWPRQRGESR